LQHGKELTNFAIACIKPRTQLAFANSRLPQASAHGRQTRLKCLNSLCQGAHTVTRPLCLIHLLYRSLQHANGRTRLRGCIILR
jgi:hypothetical protein